MLDLHTSLNKTIWEILQTFLWGWFHIFKYNYWDAFEVRLLRKSEISNINRFLSIFL